MVCEWGGLYNSMIMDGLKTTFPTLHHQFDKLQAPQDAKEAALIAFLADAMIVEKDFSGQ